MNKEFIDIYNHMGEVIGVADRSVANRTGLWHLCTQCWVIRGTSIESASLVFQIRSEQKKVSPGVFDVSASGHVPTGLSAKSSMVKELEEELGINVSESDLIFLGKRIDMYQKNQILSRIFAEVFFLCDNTPITEYKIDPNELKGIAEIPILEGLELFSNKVKSLKCKAYLYENTTLLPTNLNIKLSNFVTRQDNFYLKTFIMAERLLEGNRILSI